jgi:hypothetical protein
MDGLLDCDLSVVTVRRCQLSKVILLQSGAQDLELVATRNMKERYLTRDQIIEQLRLI